MRLEKNTNGAHREIQITVITFFWPSRVQWNSPPGSLPLLFYGVTTAACMSVVLFSTMVECDSCCGRDKVARKLAPFIGILDDSCNVGF